MSLLSYKIVAALLIFSVSLAVIIYPLSRRATNKTISETAELGEALASGIFFGAALFHMLPEAIHTFSALYPGSTYPYPELICAMGYFLLLFLERFSTNGKFFIVPYMLLTMLTIHALTEGAALGLGTSLSETLMIFIAIMAHKGTETFALCVTFMRHEFSLSQVVSIIIFFALMSPLGIMLGSSLHLFSTSGNSAWIEATFNAFAAGTFLYISTLHHIHFHKHAKDVQGLAEFGCLFAGAAAMAAIACCT